MLRVLSKLHPEIDTLVICTDVSLLRYYIQTKMETVFNIDKNYSVEAETGVLYRKLKNDALTAPMLGDRWLITATLEKVGTDNALSMLSVGNGNALTILFVDKYITYKRFISENEFKKYKATIMPLYLGKFDMDDIPYLHKDMLGNNGLKDDVLTYLCKNYRYDVDKVMTLFTKMRSGLKIYNKQDLIDEVGLGGVTPESVLFDLLRLYQPSGKYGGGTAVVSEKRKANAVAKYTGLLKDLHSKMEYIAIYKRMYNAILGTLALKSQILNGRGEREQEIPRAVNRFAYLVRNEIDLKRTLFLLNLFEQSPKTYDYESRLIYIFCSFISSFKGSETL